jgi:hypothetical protein
MTMTKKAKGKRKYRRGKAGSKFEDAQQWCSEHGIDLIRPNGLIHWKFRQGGRQIDWYPSTGSTVIEGVRVKKHPDWPSMQRALEAWHPAEET